MYGPPLECKKNWVGGEAVCENVSGLEWRMVSGRMMMIRACPSLIIAPVAGALVFAILILILIAVLTHASAPI